jgi:hypothetical protein
MQLPTNAARGFELLQTDSPFNEDEFMSTITSFLDFFQHSNANNQQMIRQELGPAHWSGLLGYATRAASRAIRTQSIEDVERGLVALALEGGSGDFRYTVSTLCLLHHSAIKLGADVDALFHQAAALGRDSGKQLLLGYLARGDKRIEAMAFKEGASEEGFEYIFDESVIPRGT